MMPTAIQKIKIFVSSPGDVNAERDAIKRAISWLRSLQFIRVKFDLDPYFYEDSVPPLVGDIPQQTVNKYLIRPEDTDIFICVLGARMGTEFTDPETNRQYRSGTHYEFEHAHKANQADGAPYILLYRKILPVAPNRYDTHQLQLVEEFFSAFHDGSRNDFNGLYQSFEDPSQFEELIKGHVLTVLVRDFGLLAPSSISTELGLRELILKRFEEANVVLHNYPSLIGHKHTIERPETKEILAWIDNPAAKEAVALLVDKPGTGKTVVMAHLLELLEAAGTTVFAIKADHLSGVRTAEELQHRFQLPVSLEDSVKIVAAQCPMVVLIDQLDALSISLSQDFSTLDMIHRFVVVASQIPNVRVVLSCREFDLKFDPKLSTLKHNEYVSFALAPLTKDQIQQAFTSIEIAGFNKISERMLRLLTTPLHLSIYADLALSDPNIQSGEQFYSLHQLYDALWERRITASPVSFVSETVYHLAERMQSERRLSVPSGVLDDHKYQKARLYLQTIDFIREKQGALVFFHQTFFDYSYARRFVRDNRRIAPFVFSGVQGLFERALMLQVLAYLRYADHDQYLRELRDLLSSSRLRFHLRFLLIEWFASLDDLTVQERVLALNLFNEPEDAIRFLASATGNTHWFDRLGETFFSSLLQDNSLRSRVTRYLSTVISGRPQQVVRLLDPYLGGSHEWDMEILFCLSRLADWSDTHTVDILCDVMEREREAHFVEECLAKLSESNPTQGCRAMRIYLDYLFQEIQASEPTLMQGDEVSDNPVSMYWQLEFKLRGKFEKTLGTYPLQEIIAALSQATPNAFVEYLLDWFVNVIMRYVHPTKGTRYPSDAIFGYDVYIYHTPDEIGGREETTFVAAMITALKIIAREQPNRFRIIARRLQGIEAESVQFVLLHAFLAAPEEYADDIFDYLLEDERRFDLGRDYYDSCLLFGATFRNVKPQRQQVLETKILDWYPEWERNPQHRAWGYTQTLFLQSVPRDLLSPKALHRLQELERKYPELTPHAPMKAEMVAVVSPITGEQLERASDDDILEAMRTYDETTDLDVPNRSRRRIDLGGIVELSRTIEEQAKKHPDRYFALTHRFDETTPVKYISAVLSGLAGSTISSDNVYAVAQAFADRVQGASGTEPRMQFCRALQRRADDGVPDNLLDILMHWAYTDPDPPYPDPKYDGHEFNRPNEWLQRGINSVRGVAVEAIVTCALKREPKQSERAFTILSHAVTDSSPAVGACVLGKFVLLAQFDKDRALDLCDQLLSTHQPLLDDLFTTHNFLNWASFHYFERFGKHVEYMLNTSNENIRQEGARLACQAALKTTAAEDLCSRSIQGSAAMRRGVVITFARFLPHPEYSQKCQEMLLRLASDNDEEVKRQVCFSFAHLRPERDFERLRVFITKMIQLPAIEAEPHHMLGFILQVADVEHELALQVAQRLIDISKAATGRYFHTEYDDAVGLALAVYNRSYEPEIRGRAMRLFEELLAMGVRSAKDALDNWDEHRAFAIKLVPEDGKR